MKNDFRFDHIFYESFIATNVEDDDDFIIGWHMADEDLPDEFYEEDEEEIEYFFFEKNLTFGSKV